MGAVENVKEIADLIGKFHDIELNRRILKLEEEVVDLTRDLRRAEEKVEEVQKALKVKAELVFRGNNYWLKANSEAEEQGPFCSLHYDRDGLLVRLHSGTFGDACPACVTERATTKHR